MSCYPCAPGDAVRARLGSVIRFSEDAVLPETLPHPDLVAALPRLRRYARVLTGDAHRADDLVQDTLARAWEKRRVWAAGGGGRGGAFFAETKPRLNLPSSAEAGIHRTSP